MIIQILIECEDCMKKQYASCDQDDKFHTHSCYNCNVLMESDSWTECSLEDEGKIQRLLSTRKDMHTVTWSFVIVLKDLDRQFASFSNYPNQKQAVTLAINRVHLRKTVMNTKLRQINEELEMLGFIDDPSYKPRLNFSFIDSELEVDKTQQEITITKNKIKQQENESSKDS